MSEAAEAVRDWAADLAHEARRLWQSVNEAMMELGKGQREAGDLGVEARHRTQEAIGRVERCLDRARDLLEEAANRLEDLVAADLEEDG